MKIFHNGRPHYDRKSNVGSNGQKFANRCSSILKPLKQGSVYMTVISSLQCSCYNLTETEHTLTSIMTMTI
jgi:hypothetical protein